MNGITGVWQNIVPALLVLLYLALVVLVRWNLIARPTQGLLHAQVNTVRVRFRVDQIDVAQQTPEENVCRKQAEVLLDQASGLVSQTGGKKLMERVLDVLLWSRGHECQGWRLVHEAERILIQVLPGHQVYWRLVAAKGDLESIAREYAPAEVAHRQISALVDKVTADGVLESDRRACLQDVQRLIYNARDNYYEDLVNWHNKALFLIVIGALLVLLLALTSCHPMLLLVGAVGGFLSRLARSLQGGTLPIDYGAYWTTLFLSPIAGALAAWAGVLLLATLSGDPINILGGFFSTVEFAGTTGLSEVTMAAAFLLGFSERLFMQIVSAIEDRAAGAEARSPAPEGASASEVSGSGSAKPPSRLREQTPAGTPPSDGQGGT